MMDSCAEFLLAEGLKLHKFISSLLTGTETKKYNQGIIVK